MPLAIAMVIAILLVALVLFVTEWIRMDLVALLVLSALALSGLVTPVEAFAGFSNPAVITVWAMFIMSEGLARTGIAEGIGRRIAHVAGTSEVRMITLFMLVGGGLSAFMNNIGVAALLVPVAVEVAGRSGVAPSRLLMPLAYGTLLGGMMTLIGTPPNLLIHMSLREVGQPGMGFFQFAWIGLPVLLAGTAFMALAGRHMLPSRALGADEAAPRDLRSVWQLDERILALRIPDGSAMAGRSIADSGLGSAAGLLVIALERAGRTMALPAADMDLHAGDVLLVQGRADRFDRLDRWAGLILERESPVLHEKLLATSAHAELTLAENSALVGAPIRHRSFRERFGVNLLAIRRGEAVRRTRLADYPIQSGDIALVQGQPEAVTALREGSDFSNVMPLNGDEAFARFQLDERLFVLRVPEASPLVGETLGENQLADAFDFRLLALIRDQALIEAPGSEEVLETDDLLLMQGREADLDTLRALQQLERLRDVSPWMGMLNQGALEYAEAALHPQNQITERRIGELQFPERYGVQVAAIWRSGLPLRTGLDAKELRPGDGLLFIGPRAALAKLAEDESLIVLNPVQTVEIDRTRAPLAGTLMVAVVLAVLAGLAPIAVAAVAGAALMVLTRCLTMEQAYRAVDWRSIFLIAAMLPLGVAMQSSGTAGYLSDAALGVLAPFGPWPVIAGLYAITAIGTLIMPNAALVLLMAPIALSASAGMGISPYPAMVAVALAASASFASPVAHPASVLVMGLGGYRFVDYLRVGLPLTLVVFALAFLLMPFVWPI
jgi:di/tricarboxylate transporter